MNESMVTFQGWLGSDVRTRQAGDNVVAWFRVGSTPRRFHRGSGEWSDGPTQWYTVNAWRGLGEHCAASLRNGDPVVVHGRLTQSTWVNNDGVEVTSLEVDAVFVGHDLNRGDTRFTKATRVAPREPGNEPQQEEPTPIQQQSTQPGGTTTGWVA